MPSHPPCILYAGTPTDQLRAALVWLLTSEALPTNDECAQVEGLLAASGADVAAWGYVKRMRRMNLTGKQQPSVAEGLASLGTSAQSQLTTLLGSTFGQGLSSLTKGVRAHGGGQWLASLISWLFHPLVLCLVICFVAGSVCLCQPVPCRFCVTATGVKTLLAGEQQAAVTVAVEALMDSKPNPDTDSYLLFDPKV